MTAYMCQLRSHNVAHSCADYNLPHMATHPDSDLSHLMRPGDLLAGHSHFQNMLSAEDAIGQAQQLQQQQQQHGSPSHGPGAGPPQHGSAQHGSAQHAHSASAQQQQMAGYSQMPQQQQPQRRAALHNSHSDTFESVLNAAAAAAEADEANMPARAAVSAGANMRNGDKPKSSGNPAVQVRASRFLQCSISKIAALDK